MGLLSWLWNPPKRRPEPDTSKMVPIHPLVDNRTYTTNTKSGMHPWEVENTIYDRIKLHRRAIERMEERIKSYENDRGSVYPEDEKRVVEIRRHIALVATEIGRLVKLHQEGYEYESEVTVEEK